MEAAATHRFPARAALLLAVACLLPSCDCSGAPGLIDDPAPDDGAQDGHDHEGTQDQGLDDGTEDPEPDGTGDDAGPDEGRDADIREVQSDRSEEVSDQPICPADCPFPCFPGRCADEPIPGFRELEDGWYRPCNCFDGEPLRAVPISCIAGRDEGHRTVPFDCAWPEGMIYHRDRATSGPIDVNADGCGHMEEALELGRFSPEPYRERFNVSASDPRLPRDRICFPVECVFDTPGEPARCSRECAPYPDYETIYRVDRSRCDEAP